jgi:hypothetical protein
MMAVEAMPTPAAVKPLAKREADFSDNSDRYTPEQTAITPSASRQ